MRLVVARSHEAFEEVYRRHVGAVFAVCSRIAPDRSTADDLTQQTFLALWTRATGITDIRSSLRPWLITVVRNAAIDRQRRTRETVELDFNRASVNAGPPEVAIQNQRDSDIRRALAGLAEDQRTVIELAYFGGLTQSQIAAVLGAPLGTVKSRVRLAMQRLRSLIDTFGVESPT